MNPRQEIFIRALFVNEGIYSNHPADAGGETIFGISKRYHPEMFQKVYSAWMAGQDPTQLLIDFYFAYYSEPIWDEFSAALHWKLFDLSVNLGKKRAIELIRKAILNLAPYAKLGGGVAWTDYDTEAVFHFGGTELYHGYIWAVWRYYKTRPQFLVFGRGWRYRLLRGIDTNWRFLQLPKNLFELKKENQLACIDALYYPREPKELASLGIVPVKTPPIPLKTNRS